MSDIQHNLKAVQNKINKVCQRAGKFVRAPADINLIAVSKKQDEARIEAMLKTGHRLYGENRVQEAQVRWENRRNVYQDLCLHLIGPLQTNKVKDAVALFDVIQTLDRLKLIQALADEMKKQDKNIPCFIQVNTGEEPQKSGVLPQDVPAFLTQCHEADLNIIGLMCLPPVAQPPALHFAFLKKLADDNGLKELSMGMSGDFEKAIPIGATYVRVGTALFGARETVTS